jgi:Fic family protein
MYVAPPPRTRDLQADISPERQTAAVRFALEAEREYLHWDKVRHLTPPHGLTHEEWWLGIKIARQAASRWIPLRDAEGARFTYTLPDAVLRRLHVVDQRSSGAIATPEVVTADDEARRQYLVNSLMEEAIRSSQLEGANTTRRVAKELLRTGREPQDRSERMIANNYRALRWMREEMGDQLTPADVLELHRIVTEGTLDDSGASGRLQRPDEERIAVVDQDGTVLHDPPPADQLPDRLEAMCAFANAPHDGEPFIHPVIRGILLHFWLAYDHPFEDGNGRTARVLFSWYLRSRGYWLVEYLSISKILRQAPAKYKRSFLETESDERDATYFIAYQLEVIEQAIEQLHRYLDRKVAEVKAVERLIRGSRGFNHRQLALLSDALRNPDGLYTFGSHATRHGVTHETARTDLRDLAARGVLEIQRAGRRYLFRPPQGLADRLQELGASDDS